ncbi:ATP-binding cassette a-factor transporter STE6 NDAI_0D01540 [Naumovozyma dairenensis CBS 421]|uniref:Alpha-factor-transporting ATPase n=1 Tax=Naumovozyma dairenensis (strain ATCC 10597 / BCRC 20456 / CBS 421 / NBRC 0211 / NRRL Y-12639) TaxID=1071378 RepID=G0W9K7_NAUDC|nr:hypothetical protein NDAI_0D01540 [Naumovozyma dairenensis CBS 421]CCD24468.1 hypothetical protein NDAI_0D01540 [Naumovozyma dairenensis CBS 421]
MKILEVFKRYYKHHIYMHVDLKKDKYLICLIIISTIANGLVPAITSILTGRVFDLLSNIGQFHSMNEILSELTIRSMSIMALAAACLPVMWISISSWMSLGERQGFAIRKRLLNEYLVKPMEWYDCHDKLLGDFTQVNRCVEELRSSSAEASAITFQNFVAMLALIGTSFYYSWSLTLIILCSAPLIILFAILFSHMIHKYTELENSETGKAAQLLNWSMNSAQLVKLYCTQAYEIHSFKELVGQCNDLFIKSCFYVSANTSILRFLSLSMFVQGFWFGAIMVKKGKLSIKDVITCFHSCLMLGSTLNNTLQQIVVLQKGDVALKKILDFISFSQRSPSLEPPYEPSVPISNGEISFQNISFAYPTRPHQTVLKDVSITFQPGRSTFIIGKSGSGKSTLANLLLKFYNDYQGSIKIGNTNVKKINKNWLFENITVVEQRCTLFNDTLRNNLLLGISNSNQKVEQDDIEISQRLKDACRIAMLEELIRELPDGLDTIIGAGGVSLSGGQQQRVAIARAYIKDSSVLILDEAVSALDIIHRELIMKAIKNWRSGKTTIILTHDLSQLDYDDFLYVFEDGEVKESGYQQALLQDEKTIFSKLYDIQMRKHMSYSPSESTIVETPGDEKKRFSSTNTSTSTSYEVDTPISKENKMSFSTGRDSWSENVKLSDVHRTQRKRIYLPENNKKKCVDPEKALIKIDEKKVMPLGQIIKRMLRTIRQKKLLSFGIFWSLIAGATNPIFSYCFSYLLNGIVPMTNGQYRSQLYLLKWSFIVLGISAADAISNFLKSYILGYCSELWIMDLRNEAMAAIMNKRLDWFSKEENKSSELSALLLNDLRDLRSLVSEFLSAMTTFIVVSLVGLIWALVSGWKLSLVCISMFPLIILVSGIYGSTLQRYETMYKTAVAELENHEYEIMTKIKTIRYLQASKYFIKNYKVLENNLKKIAHKRSIATGFGISITNTIAVCIQSILYYYGLRLVFKGEYSSKKMFETFTLLLFTIISCTSLVSQIPDISRGQRAASWLYRILDESDDNKESVDSGSRSADIIISGNTNSVPLISIKNLRFSYPSAQTVEIYKNITLHVTSSQKTIGIVGESGSGKSTLMYLLTKLYKTPANSIYIDGTDVNEWDTLKLRKQISVVEQNPTLFEGTVRDNLVYGTLNDISEIEIYDVLKYLGIYEFIENLPMGLDSRIDTKLVSGGQAQRLCIARALLRKPTILILDECTSALDAASAHLINNLVKNGLPTVLTIVITHSKQMMEACNSLAVIKDGRLAEQGNFAELMKNNSELRRIINELD